MNLLEAIRMSETEATACWTKIKTYLTSTSQIDKLAKLGNMPPIIWSKFGFRTAGRYRWWTTSKKDQIEMNINFLNIEDPNKFIISTMRHELAHCINQRIGSGGNHDASWKAIARLLGDDAGIYHEYGRPTNAPVRKTTIHSFDCTCGQHFDLTARRFTMAKNGRYRCASWGKNLSKVIHNLDN